MGRRVFTCFKHGKACIYVSYAGGDVSQRVMMRRRYGKACIYVSYAWRDVSQRVMMRRGYGKACFTCHDQKGVWGSVFLRVLSTGRRDCTCPDEEGYSKVCVYVF